jgi:uncharacterized repeat protein (TIGR01451 family)
MKGLSVRETSVARAGSARIFGPTRSKRGRRFLFLPILMAALVGLGVLATGGSVLAASPTDANVSDYQQCANDKPGSAGDPTDCVPQGWINGILNAQNSQYSEDQVTPQRLDLVVPSGGTTTGRTITISYLARKGQGGVGNHAYDSLATWNYTQVNADRCQGLAPADCPGGSASTFLIPSDTTVVADSNGPGSSTALHELPDANRMMTMYGGTITGVSAPVHDNAAGPGDDFATLTVTYSVASTAADTKVQLLFGGHLAASTGPRGWGINVGSSFINGGPYHIRLTQLDSSSVGNRDNQINSAAILPIGTQTRTALHETDSSGTDVSPPNNQDPATQTGITVTLPVGGSGTYVTDYATVAPSGSTGTVAFRFYTSLADCNADTNFNGGTSAGSGKTLDANSVAKSNPVHITDVGVTYWRAVFTGTGVSANSDSGCSGEILTAVQATSLTTNAGGPYLLGADGTVALHDVAHLAGGTSNAGGTITFMLFSDNACSAQVGGDVTTAVNGADGKDYESPSITVSAPGTYYWIANYSGDANNAASSTVCGDASESPLVIKPHISISKSPDAQTILLGQTATFTITVTNDGNSVLTNVVVTDALAPGCARTQADIPALASMAPGATVTYTCTLANVTSSFTNVAVATGKPPVGPNVTAQDTAAVTAVAPATHPAITIVKNPKSQTVTSGGTATFTITVTNTGDVALTNVTVSDALSPNCNRTIGTLNPGQSTSYTCTRANVTASFNNVAVATGHAGATTVTAQDTAPVTAKAAPLKPKTVTRVTPKVVSHKKPKATG